MGDDECGNLPIEISKSTFGKEARSE
mgnify:CR=1